MDATRHESLDSSDSDYVHVEAPDQAKPTIPDFSIGCELEFVMYAMERCVEQYGLHGSHLGLYLVHEVLSQPMTATCALCNEEHIFQLPLNSTGNPNPNLLGWMIDADLSVHARDFREKYEICFDCTESTSSTNPHTHEISFSEHLRVVLKKLNDEFNTPTGTHSKYFRIAVNDTCGYHVHIGNGFEQRFGQIERFPLGTVKNVMSLYVANEKAIDAMHATTRIDGSKLHNDPEDYTEYNAPLHRLLSGNQDNYTIPQSALFAAHAYTHACERPSDPRIFPHSRELELESAVVTNTLESRLQMINLATSIPDLQCLQGDGHITTLDLSHLQGNHRGVANWVSKGTMEFRQHAGTLDIVEIMNWLFFLIQLVDYAQRTPVEDVYNDCRDMVQRHARFETLHFLEILGFNKQEEGGVFKHYKRVLGLKRDPTKTYAETQFRRQLAAIQAFPVETGDEDRDSKTFDLNKLWLDQITYNAETKKPEAVRRKLQEKLVAGCYGQFTSAQIAELENQDIAERTFSDIDRERLTVGWKPVVKKYQAYVVA